MIKILIRNEENCFKSLEVKGHANSAPHGEDLVCAAVSAVITGGFNAIKDIENFHYELKEGYAYLEAKETVSSHDLTVIETIITSLKTIAESNSRYVKIQN
ncbi:MAG: ribosomal-processing cysteine protease Prp [Bacilli bacterium]|nr:ribosomal-processing cysteine protease Prp [Bacilli bacterium]